MAEGLNRMPILLYEVGRHTPQHCSVLSRGKPDRAAPIILSYRYDAPESFREAVASLRVGLPSLRCQQFAVRGTLPIAGKHVPLLGKQRLHPIDDRAHAGGAAQIAVDDDPVFGGDLRDWRRQPLKQGMAVADIAGPDASAWMRRAAPPAFPFPRPAAAPSAPAHSGLARRYR